MNICLKPTLRKVSFFYAILLFYTFSAAEVFDIDSYIKKALSLSYEVKEEKENLEIAQRDYFSNVSKLYFPEIYYNLGSTLYSDLKTNFSLNKNDFSSKFYLNYNFFNNFKDKLLLEIAYLKKKQAENRLWLKKQEITLDAIKKYCDLLKNYKLLEVMKANEDSYATEYEKSKIYYSQGLRSYSDLLKSELNLKNAQLSTIYAQNLSKTSLMEFNYRIYEKPLTDNIAKEISFDENIEILPLEKAIEEALKSRKELEIYNDDLKIKEKELKKNYIGKFPDIRLDFSYSRSEIFGLGNTPGRNNNYGLVFSLSMPFGASLYDKYKDYSNALIYKERVNREIEQLKLSIEKEVISSYLDLEYAKKKYEVSKTNVEISKMNLEIIKSKYGEGKASVVELIEAQKDDLQAQSNLAESFYEFYKSLVLYNKAIGKQLWKE